MNYKEAYIKMRNSQKLDNQWLWEYYKQEGGKITDPNEFIENFYIMQQPIKIHNQTVGYQRAERDLGNFFEDIDKKFGLHTLWDKEGNFVKVVQ